MHSFPTSSSGFHALWPLKKHLRNHLHALRGGSNVFVREFTPHVLTSQYDSPPPRFGTRRAYVAASVLILLRHQVSRARKLEG